ncbi:hypothetical protein EXD76_07840 [BEV proteobacterium]|nr:hypothetical protein [Candidatus Symbiopectobacterium sp. Chty_BC]
MKRRILTTQNHAVRLHEKTVHLRGQAFSTKTGMEKQHDYLLFNKAVDTFKKSHRRDYETDAYHDCRSCYGNLFPDGGQRFSCR